MSKHLIVPLGPGTLHPKVAPNGATPKPSFFRRAADGMNTIATYHKKLITAKCQMFTGGVVGGDATVITPWPFYFVAGENTTGVRLFVGITDTDYGAASNPNVVFTLKLASDGSTVDSFTFNYNGRGYVDSGYQALNKTSTIHIDLSGTDPGLEYYVDATVNDGARLVFMSAWEFADRHADDSVDGIVDPSKYIDGGPIHAEHIADLLNAGTLHWKHGGCHYLTWNADYAFPTTVSATSYTNVVDGSSTSVSANSPGFVIASQYHGTQTTAAAGPAVKIAVKASRTAGAGSLSVQLSDGTNTIVKTGITTGGVGDWYTGTGNIPSQVTKWDVMAKVSAGGTTFDLAAVCMFALT